MNYNNVKHILTMFALISGLMLMLSGRDEAAIVHAADPITVACQNGVGDVDALFDAIIESNINPGVDKIVLGADCVYSLTTPKTTDTGLPHIEDNLIIEGSGAVIRRAPSAPTKFRLMYVYPGISLTVNDLTLRGGNNWPYIGGAVYGDQLVDLVFNRVNFENNSGKDGGAIYTQGLTTINHSSFVNNAAENQGGAIYSTKELIMTQSDLRNNFSYKGGGAIYAMGETTVHDSRFLANRTVASMNGGAILSPGRLTLKGSYFAFNSAGNGGAVNGDDVLIDLTVFRDNTAYKMGGGVYALNAHRGISNTHFENNGSNGHGGGLFVAYKLDLRRNFFNRNQSKLLGGGLAYQGGTPTPAVIENNLWVNNKSDDEFGLNAMTLGELGVSPIHVRHNTVVSHIPGLDNAAIRIEGGEVLLENNILTGFQTAIKDNSGQAVSSFNLYYGNITNEDGLIVPGDNILQADPRFVSEGNYRLGSESAAIDSAAVANESKTLVDILGTPRPQGTHPDRGAYEYTGEDERVFAVACVEGSAGLAAAITAANHHFGPDVVQIEDGDCLFELSPVGHFYFYGPVGLPAVTDTLRLDGGGATLERPESEVAFRILENYADKLTLENLTVRNGYAEGQSGVGGGIYSSTRSSLHLIEVELLGNHAGGNGGGVYSEGPLRIEKCRVLDNTGFVGGGVMAYQTLRLHNSVIADNEAVEYGGGVWARYGTITHTLFQNNRAALGGGGIVLNEVESVQASTFAYNQAGINGGHGLLVNYVLGTREVSNNVWLRNGETTSGATLKIASVDEGSNINIWHNTFVGGQSKLTTAVELHSPNNNTSFLVANNIIVSHAVGIKRADKGTLTTGTNLYFDNVTNEIDADYSGNHIEAEPRFANPSDDDFHLSGDSDAIDNAVNRGVDVDRDGIPRPQGAGFDIGAYEYSLNSTPAAAPDSYSMNSDTSLAIKAPGVLVNDSDAEEDKLTAVLEDDVTDGTLTLKADGSFTYQPDAGFTGSDNFTYRASDGQSQSAAVTVTINILPPGTPLHSILLPVVIKP